MADGRLYIEPGIYKSKVIVEDHAKAIKARFKPRWIAADHDAEDRATLKRRGITTKAAKKDVTTGIQAVQKRFMLAGDGKPRLFINRACREVINELYAYSWEESKEGRAEKEVPKKLDDHAMDALRYMVAEIDLKGRSMVIG